jgi:hypothetical protein
MDYAVFNAAWLDAWSAKDVDALVDRYYSADVVYRDAQTATGLTGSAELRAYLAGLFAAMPPTRYVPDETWELADRAGFCGRWIATMELPGGGVRRFRGFDLCLVSDGKIRLNEVYTHDLPAG